jgi:integrase
MNVHTALRRALADAVEDGLLVRNPAAGAFKLASERPEMRTWTPAELGRFLATAQGERLCAMFRVAATTGLRRGEVMALTWRGVNLDNATVSVTQQLSRQADGSYGFGRPKTARSRRLIAIDAGTVAELRRHRARQAQERLQWGADYREHDLVFAREDGSALSVDGIGNLFDRLAKRAGLRRLRFHDLRHTAATMALAAGIHPKVVQERLGHSSIAMTMDTYSHALAGMGSEAADRIAALIEAAG